jgi:hypothetical protein
VRRHFPLRVRSGPLLPLDACAQGLPRAGRHLGADRSGAATAKRAGAPSLEAYPFDADVSPSASGAGSRSPSAADNFGRSTGQQSRPGRLASEVADEARVSLAHGELTAEVAMSLTTRPDDFVVTVYGTRATLRLDLQNMLLDLARLGPGPRSFARGARVVGSGLRMLTQTARNAACIAARLDSPPGKPLHLIRAHYAALAAGRELPAPLARARQIVEITRTIWRGLLFQQSRHSNRQSPARTRLPPQGHHRSRPAAPRKLAFRVRSSRTRGLTDPRSSSCSPIHPC